MSKYAELDRRLSGQRNQCPTCGERFNSNAAFDKHRTGAFGKDRRCMTVAEMRAAGMETNARGDWVTARNPQFAREDVMQNRNGQRVSAGRL